MRSETEFQAVVMEAKYWQRKFDDLLKVMTDSLNLRANPPVKLLANAESYEAGRLRGLAESEQAMMQLFTDPENQPTQHGTVTTEYMEKEIAAEREACAQLCESEGERIDASWMSCAAAIRARGANE